MKLVVLEKRPWIASEIIDKIEELGVDEILIVYYRDGKQNAEKIKKIKSKCKRKHVKWVEVDTLNFEKVMNELFADKDRIFFFNLAVNNKAEFFEERINVKYAKKRFEQGDKRIWFYTASGEYNIRKINKSFENHNISLVNYIPSEDKLVFDTSDVKRVIECQKSL